MKSHYTPPNPATGSTCRSLNMKNIEPLHPLHSLVAGSSAGNRHRLSSKGEQASSTELLESAQAQDLESVPQPEAQHEHAL